MTESCDCTVVNKDIVEKVKKGLYSISSRADLAEFYKIMGDPTRVSILNALSISELCVCDIAALLDMSHSAISHQLKWLKQARLVKNRRESKKIYYSLNDHHIKQIFALGMEHIKE